MKKSNNKVGIIFLVFFLFLYVQHQFVYMYFDDYGYGSITYGVDLRPDGMQYSLMDILQYLKWHYLCWGGRVLYYFFLIVSLKVGLGFIQVLQAVIIFGIIIALYRLVKTENDSENVCLAIMLCAFYGMFDLIAVQEGLFWYAAASSYVWPLLPFFVAVYYQRKFAEGDNSKKNVIISAILFFLSAFSQEQVAVLIIVYVILYNVFYRLEHKVAAKGAWPTIVASLLGGIIMIGAPGNYARSSSAEHIAFAELSLIEKIGQNFPLILRINLGEENCTFAFVLLISGLILSIMLLQKSEKNRALCKCNIGANLFLAMMMLLGWNRVYPEKYLCVIITIWIILYCVNVSLYFWQKQKYIVALFWGGICSQGMLVVSPTIPPRCIILFQFTMYLVVATILLDFTKDRKNYFRFGIVGLFACMSLMNVLPITMGYYENHKIQQINHYKLIEKSERIKAGMECNEIILYRLKDDRYASKMPYQKTYMQYWLRSYYEIPQDVNIIWEDLNQAGYSKEIVISDLPEISAMYPEVIDKNTVYNADGSLNLGITPKIMSENLEVIINGNAYPTVAGDGFISTVIPADILTSDLEIRIRDNNTGMISESREITIELMMEVAYGTGIE